MVRKTKYLYLLIFVLIFLNLNFVFAEVDCGSKTGNYSTCNSFNASCMWMNNSGAIPANQWCLLNSTNYNSTILTMWFNGTSFTYNQITGGLLINAGCCEFKSSGGGNMAMGCRRFDGNRSGCSNSSTYGVSGCSWKANDANQNSMCSIKKIGDWTPVGNPVNNVNDVGCCEMKGCWDYKGNQALLGVQNCTNVLNGVCNYNNYGAGCPETGGCCSPKSCYDTDVIITQTKCEQLIQLGVPCSWNGTTCGVIVGGGCLMYNTTSSCMNKIGCYWNGTGCSSGSGGGGGSMFSQEAKCWFADNRPVVCGNVTGCVYCNDTNKITNASSACYNAIIGNCKGHEPKFSNWNGTASINITDISNISMVCGDIKLKQVCNCGPLPNCMWNNGSVGFGNYCVSGTKSDSDRQTCQPPVMFCEDSLAKNNQTLCDLLATDYMMPCKWDNTTTPANNCTFNSNAIFGASSGGMGSMDYNVISSEVGCISAGGTWKKEYYEDTDGSFKQDQWCEKGALFSFSSGQAFANKGNCDSDCWACEFNSTGGAWNNNATLAQQACQNSKKGICQWKTDTSAPNKMGRCDYPTELSFGANSDCNSDCKACEFMGNSTQAQQACSGSAKGCSWANDTTASKGGVCISSSKKSCSSDCFACYSQSECINSTGYHPAFNCSWDTSFKLCKPFGFTGEICFDGMDNDNDGKIDCADSDCAYDQFCGGASIGSGSGVDCKKILVYAISCRNNVTASGLNCTWVTPQGYIGNSYCDFPGTDCWMYDNNITACRKDIRGCIYRNASGGYPLGAGGPQIVFKSFNGFCDINKTKSNICYNATNSYNYINCNSAMECIWVNDSYVGSVGGRCEFRPFAMCSNNTNVISCNAQSSYCAWRNNSFSSLGGFCEPTCANRVQGSCFGFCAWKSSTCEVEAFGGMEMGGGGAGVGGGGFGCHINDGNQTGCIAQNMSCSWMSFSQNSSQGVCESKGMKNIMDGMDTSPPKMLGIDPADVSPNEIDIRQFGMKDSPASLSFGIMVTNITNGAICRGYYIGSNMMMGGQQSFSRLGNGTTTTKFHWFLDTNKNVTDGCNATKSDGTNLTGFEFLIKYVVSLDNQTVNEQKSFYKCSNGNWLLTNVALTSNRQYLCGTSMPGNFLGGAMVMVDKETIQSFTEYNKTVPMRVFVSSANGTYSENNPQDSVSSPGYYTPGSADFKFVDCSNPNTKDSKCKNFQKYGFNLFEDCKNGVDDDGDGLIDCDDPKCKFTPACKGSSAAFNFVADANDNQAPSITFSQVDVLRDSAFVKFDTDEPANGTLDFYSNDSTCGTVNTSINDIGDPSVAFDDFKPFHVVNLDLNNLGYLLNNNTIYYYKTTVCDPSSNCATSACQNFTTSNDPSKNFIFKMKLPPGCNVSIPSLNYYGNFTKVVGGTLFEVGVKTNASVSRNINVTVNCGTQSFTFVGVDILKPKSIDMSGAFISDSANKVLGMNSSSKSWNQLIGDIGMGGQSDYIMLTYPVAYSSGNTIQWCDDSLTICTTVNNYATCGDGGNGKTNCKIPTSLGFSAYQISVPSSGTTTTSGGGGGGGSAGKTYTISEYQLGTGYTQSLGSGDKIRFVVSGENHTMTLTKISATSATIFVTSKSQSADFSVGEEKGFDVNEDGKNDLSVKLNSITNLKASFTIKSISSGAAGSSAPVTGGASSSEGSGSSTSSGSGSSGGGVQESKANLTWLWVIIGVVIAIFVIGLIFYFVRRRNNY